MVFYLDSLLQHGKALVLALLVDPCEEGVVELLDLLHAVALLQWS
jgi:hypothetical protein